MTDPSRGPAPDGSPRRVARLQLVWDADSGTVAAVADSALKLFGRGCSLCSVTHGLTGERPAWSRLRGSLRIPVDAFHRDELDPDLERFLGGRLPAVVAQIDASPDSSGTSTRTERVLLLGPDALDRCRGSVDRFRRRLVEHADRLGWLVPGLE